MTPARSNHIDREAELLAVSAAWDAALIANDAEAFASFTTDDWVYVGPAGPTPKADIVSWIVTGQLAHHTMQTIGPTRVAVYRDTVVINAHKTSSGAWGGVAYTADEWISEVFVWQSGRWRCVMSHKCPAER